MPNQAHAPEQCSTVFGRKPKMPAMSFTNVSAVRCIAAAAAAVVHLWTQSPRLIFPNVLAVSPSRETCTSFRCGEGSPVASARLVSLIQARQLETPLSTVDSSEGVGPKAAHTLDSVERGYKTPALLILHLCQRNLLDLNQNFMSQLSGFDTDGWK